VLVVGEGVAVKSNLKAPFDEVLDRRGGG